MENIVTEYKRELTDGFEREVVAFFNTMGGKICIGVDDCGNVVGLNNVDEIALKITDKIKNNILPSVMGLFNVDILEENGKKYITVIIAGGLERPYYLKSYGLTPKGCFIRIGSQTSQMEQNMIDDLFSRRVSNTLHNVVSPNQALTFSQLKIFYEETGHNVLGEYFLYNLDLFTDNGKYNYAAYLMSDNNGSSIKVARFSGTEKIDILERNEFGQCCLIKSAKNVLEKLKLFNSMAVRVGGDAQRKQIPLIDEDALREAVLNAFIHNDYINGAYPVFEVYDDRIEIISSGGLPVGLSQNEFFAGRSLPRNKELMRIFSDLDMGEQLGMGMKKILSLYPKDVFGISEHFLSVKFVFNQGAMKILETENVGLNDENVGLKSENVGINDENVGINDENVGLKSENVGLKSENVGINGENVGLTKTEESVLNELKQNHNNTAEELASKLQKTKRTIERALSSLQGRGLIVREGSKKIGCWKIKNK